MRMRAWTAVLVFGLGVALIAGTALAQPPGGRGGQRGPGGFFGGGPGGGMGVQFLLRSEKIQKELELTDDQKAELQKIAEQAREKMREAFQSGQRDPQRFRQLMEETNKAIQNVLLPHQQKRLNQIQLQLGGIAAAVEREDVRKELAITEDQLAKIREARDKVREELRGQRPQQGERPDPAQMRERFREMRQKVEEAVLSVLTDEQKEKWNDMIGEKIDIDFSELFPAPAGGPGGPRGGGNRGT